MSGSILIAEDNRELGEQIGHFLTEVGYNPTWVLDGQELVDEYVKQVYDVVLCDLKMPNMDGMEALRIIKKTDPNAVVILFTGYATVKKAVESMKLGAFDFVEKPIDFEKFGVVIQKAQHY